MIVFVTTAFVTPNWTQVDYRFYGTKFHKLGLWVHCFNSLPDQNDLTHKRFFVACRWIFNPFTEGYREIRYLIVPPFFRGNPVLFYIMLHWNVDINRADSNVPVVH